MRFKNGPEMRELKGGEHEGELKQKISSLRISSNRGECSR
jgi:hypothetical protein